MKLTASFNLTALSPGEMARFEAQCRKEGIAPEVKFSQLIKQYLHAVRARCAKYAAKEKEGAA